MARETIRVKIDKEGNLEIETKGFVGKNCTEATSNLELFLGKAGEKEYTADYYKKGPRGKKTFITTK